MSGYHSRKGKGKRFGMNMPQYSLSGSRSGSRGVSPKPRAARMGDGKRRKLPFAGDAEARENSALNKEDTYIQGEYITNLQQQIYFLELELQVMKEKASSGQFAGKSGLATNAPLDTHMNSLRDKYNHMESKYKKKLKAAREDSDLLQSNCTKLKRENTRLGERIDRMEAQLLEYSTLESELTEKHLSGKLDLEDKLKKLHNKLGDTDTRFRSRMDEFREHRASVKLVYLNKDEEIADITMKLERAAQETAHHRKCREESEVKLLESQEGAVLSGEQVGEQKKEIQKLIDDQTRLEHEVRKKDMDIDREKSAKERFEKDLMEVRKECEDLTSDLKTEKRKTSDTEKSETRWSSTIVELRVDNEKALKEINTLKEKVIEREHILEKLREEHHTEQERNNDHSSANENMAEQLEKLNKSQEELAQQMLEREKENILKTEELNKLLRKHNTLEKDHEEVHKHRDTLTAEVEELKHYRETADQIKNLQNICDFQQMMQNNLKVAESIKQLHSSLSTHPSRADNYSSGHASRADPENRED